MITKSKRNTPIVKQLSEKYGGKWKHIPFHGVWICDDLDLRALYHFEGGYDIDGSPMTEKFSMLKGLYVYGLKTGTERFYPNRIKK